MRRPHTRVPWGRLRVSAATALGKGSGATWSGLRSGPEGLHKAPSLRPPQPLVICSPLREQVLTAEAGMSHDRIWGPSRGPGLVLAGTPLGVGLPNGPFIVGLKAKHISL